MGALGLGNHRSPESSARQAANSGLSDVSSSGASEDPLQLVQLAPVPRSQRHDIRPKIHEVKTLLKPRFDLVRARAELLEGSRGQGRAVDGRKEAELTIPAYFPLSWHAFRTRAMASWTSGMSGWSPATNPIEEQRSLGPTKSKSTAQNDW